METQVRAVAVLAVDDNDLVAGALERWMSKTPGIRWLGCTTDTADVLGLVAAKQPDVLLLDLDLPGVDCLALIGLLTAEFPTVKTVVVSGSTRPEGIKRALQAGAVGYVVKDERIPAIAEYALRAAAGERVLSPSARAAIAPPAAAPSVW